VRRLRRDFDGSLQEAWNDQADAWVRWARELGHDSYGSFHRDRFLELLPAPSRLTLDLGCGEGRLARHLAQAGHRVVAVDASPRMIDAARSAGGDVDYRLADAAALPFDDGSFDLVVAFMALHDMDDLSAVAASVRRVLFASGVFCFAVVHPLNAAGRFVSKDDDSPFVVERSYFESRRYADEVERDGLEMTFHGSHRTLEEYSRALEDAGFAITALREVTDVGDARWSRIPLFLHGRARPLAGLVEKEA
jgi:SAM-dependent methyltransferase